MMSEPGSRPSDDGKPFVSDGGVSVEAVIQGVDAALGVLQRENGPRGDGPARTNPLAITDAEGFPDDDLRDHLAIYRGFRDRLRVGSTSVRDVLGQMHELLGRLVEDIGTLEAEARRRGVEVGE
jgi:hypothetical protein